MTEMKKAVRDAELLRDEVKKLEDERRTLDVCVNNLTEALKSLRRITR